MSRRFLLLLLFPILLLTKSCVTPFLETFSGDREIVIVEAMLANQAGESYVSVSETFPREGSTIAFLPIENATVRVEVDASSFIELSESEPGKYAFPSDFEGVIGSSYKLTIEARGEIYGSSIEKLPEQPIIERVHHTFDETGLIDKDGVRRPSQKIFVDTPDRMETADFYMWEWKLFENQMICSSCIDGLYYRDEASGPEGECRPERFRRGQYDYFCEEQCWEIFKQEEINILDDAFSNGLTIKNRLIANIPIYQSTASLIQIRQFRIGEGAYRYLNLVQSQGQNSGGLADTPPVTLVGNVTCITNPSIPVAGYFIVASVARENYLLDKTDIPINTNYLGLLGFYQRISPEPIGNSTTRPPEAPCLESENRTAITPEGWINIR